eukprot:3938971-Rhodomonas_salina.1
MHYSNLLVQRVPAQQLTAFDFALLVPSVSRSRPSTRMVYEGGRIELSWYRFTMQDQYQALQYIVPDVFTMRAQYQTLPCRSSVPARLYNAGYQTLKDAASGRL